MLKLDESVRTTGVRLNNKRRVDPVDRGAFKLSVGKEHMR
jgi:hypothetical protein